MRPTQRSAGLEKPRSYAVAAEFVCECRETDISRVALSHTTRPDPSRPLPKERLETGGSDTIRHDGRRKGSPRYGRRATLRRRGSGSQSGTRERVGTRLGVARPDFRGPAPRDRLLREALPQLANHGRP